MSSQSSKKNEFCMKMFAITALGSVVWVNSVGAQDITPGLWEGGDPQDEDPFYICLNVSADGKRLTAAGTQCRGNQGNNQNSIDLQRQDGKTPTGDRCNQYSYRGLSQGDVTIGDDGSFVHTFSNNIVSTNIIGKFNAAEGTVAGTARTISPETDCSIEWTATASSAAPPVLPPPDATEPTPIPPTGVQGITPGPWVGGSGNPSNSTPFYACLNVSLDGQRLTAAGTRCRGNQGQNQNSLEFQWQSGTTATGAPCNGNANRDADLGDVKIGPDGRFTHTFSNTYVNVTVTGQFNAAAGTVSGTSSVVTRWSPECKLTWTAAPVAAGQ